ncbi:MAG: hypothetical protein C4525_07440 [Desulfarculus sp.]|nr:MAG: hypothetical protein C4525_07440 [Desulfarculus sp.]
MSLTPIGLYRAFRPSWRAFGVYYFGIFVFLVGPLVNPQAFIGPELGQLLASLLAAFVIITRFTRVYRVSDAQVEVEKSFPSHSRQAAAIMDIRRVDLRRGLTQRLLGVAHVYIYLQDQPAPALKLFGVPRPEQFRRVLLERGAGDERVFGAFRS